jgi:predicted O-linked N-acetylglucosamine transferase (SPINDLY family)
MGGVKDAAPSVAQKNPLPARETGVHPLLPQAVALHQAGRLGQAAAMYETILRDEPGQFDAAHMLGVVAMQEGRLLDAQRQIEHALTIKPQDPSALINLTAAYLRDGRLELAAARGEETARLAPDSLDAMINYGTALHQLGRYRDAIVPLEAAHAMNSRSTVVCNLLGSCLLKTGDARRAVGIFEAATVVAPLDADSWANLSAALNTVSEYDRAKECADRAVSLGRDSSNVLFAQAEALFDLGKIEESVAAYEKAVELNPSVTVLCGISRALITSGRPDDAMTYLRRALEIDGSNPFVRLLKAVSVLKPIYSTKSEIDDSRIAFRLALTELQSWHASTPAKDAYVAVGAAQPFFAAYQPYNNKDLLSHHGAVCVEWMKTLPRTYSRERPTGSRTGGFRVGIVSAHVRDQSVWNAILKGWVHQFDKSKFDVYLFKLDAARDQETALAKSQVQFFDDTPKSLIDWADAISDADLDALIYDEVGMDPLTLQLASMRLAPMQAATWGHPETSGLSTMDFYLSSEDLEPPNAQDNYSEQLVLLPHMGVYVEPLKPKSQDPDLRMLGLPREEPLLLCPGTPFKYSPLHDWIWIEIARGLKAIGRGRMVFFSNSAGTMHLQLSSRLRDSFARAGIDFNAHVCIIPFLDRPVYFGLMQRAALMLDTLDFSGFNTAMQAVECGLPYLAFEGEFMRGRLASCIMRRMGLSELVATDYRDFVERAVGFAADSARLDKLRLEITNRRTILFEDTVPIRALENFLVTEIGKRRARS